MHGFNWDDDDDDDDDAAAAADDDDDVFALLLRSMLLYTNPIGWAGTNKVCCYAISAQWSLSVPVQL
jgi:hypothetical protein